MAKKSVRLLSLLLAVLMLISMIPVVAAAAEDVADAEIIDSIDHWDIRYNKLVGEANQANPTYPVYVVNENWEIKNDGQKQYVTFNFRGEQVTEVYDKTRHLESVAAVYTQATKDGVDMPYCILTEGNYTTAIQLSASIYLMGAKAGMNPYVSGGAAYAEWNMSSDRKLPDIASEDTQGETRFWAGIDLATYDFAGLDSAYSDMTLKLVNCNTSSGNRDYVFDGIVFQGYGAVVADNNGGSANGTRDYYFQNVIFNNGYSYDCDQIRLWQRSGNINVKKTLNIYNCYATGMKNLGLYSGHAAEIQVNGLCWQNNYAGVFYKAQALQSQGFKFELKNSHFWNSDTIAATETPRNGNRNDSILYCDYSAVSQNATLAASNDAAYWYSITNNSFWNMNSVNKYDSSTSEYTLQSTRNLFAMGMAGTNEKLIMAQNLFGSEFNMADHVVTSNARHPLKISYLRNSAGEITHAGTTAPSMITTTDAYALTSDMIQIHDNTFVGEMYQNTVPDIGTNTHPDTLIEMTGNFHIASHTSHVGTYTVGSIEDNVYDKWVYLSDLGDNLDDPKNKSNYINEKAFSFNVVDADNTVWEVRGSDPDAEQEKTLNTASTSLVVNHTAGADDTYTNYAEVYGADSNFKKIYVETDSATQSTVEFTNSKAYFIVSLLSCDKRTSVDYKLTVDRGVDPAIALKAIVPANPDEVVGAQANNFYYEVAHDVSSFTFTADMPANVLSELKDASGTLIKPDQLNSNVYTITLPEYETAYEYTLNPKQVVALNETFNLTFVRVKSSEAAVLDFTSNNGTVTINHDGQQIGLQLASGQKNVEFVPTVSDKATYYVMDLTYNKKLTPASNGNYSLTNLSAGDHSYQIIVTAQNGNTVVWDLVINRPADTNTNLKNVKNATKTSDGYVANVTTSTFIVYAEAESASSKVQIFADQACTDEITNPAITLTAKSINVWLRVVAESGAKSDPIKLTINTTTTGTETDNGNKPMVDNGVIGVTGAEPFQVEDAYIIVNLGKDPKNYNFKAIGLSGYSVAIYGDAKHTLWAPTEATITPDTGITYLYAVAKKGTDVHNYTIVIQSYISVDFTDSIADWAKSYVSMLESSGSGLMKGDEHGAFNGDANLNRYEMAIMMVRLTGANKDLYKDVKLPFRDSVIDWAANYVKAAYRIGLLGGHAIMDEEGNVVAYEYKGFDNATRSEFVKVFMNAIYGGDCTEVYEDNQEAIDKLVTDKKFSDVADVDDWAVPYVYLAISEGVIKGDGNRINPDGDISRYEAATVLCRKAFNMA